MQDTSYRAERWPTQQDANFPSLKRKSPTYRSLKVKNLPAELKSRPIFACNFYYARLFSKLSQLVFFFNPEHLDTQPTERVESTEWRI
jgi:hypothetical protein